MKISCPIFMPPIKIASAMYRKHSFILSTSNISRCTCLDQQNCKVIISTFLQGRGMRCLTCWCCECFVNEQGHWFYSWMMNNCWTLELCHSLMIIILDKTLDESMEMINYTLSWRWKKKQTLGKNYANKDTVVQNLFT